MQQVRVEGLIDTKADIVGEHIKDVVMATDLQDVSCYTVERIDSGQLNPLNSSLQSMQPFTH